MSLGPWKDERAGREAGQPPDLQDAAPGELDLVAQVAHQALGHGAAQPRPQLGDGRPLQRTAGGQLTQLIHPLRYLKK